MSNIDKQALLVSKAKASVFTMGYISQFEASDIDSDDIYFRFEVDAVETGTTVSIVDECGHAAQIITALLDELEAARQRIAELEAREVTLPAEKFCPSEYAGSQYWEETEVWNKAISACAVAVRAAGIKVKG